MLSLWIKKERKVMMVEARTKEDGKDYREEATVDKKNVQL